MAERNLTYFIADVHLGLRVGNWEEREAEFAKFLLSLPKNTKTLYLLGDIFDFWYEYKYVIPRGYTRTLGALATLRDSGVEIFLFKGNHDVWTYNYFEQELGMTPLEQPSVVEIDNKTFCLGHGDGLGKTPFGFRAIRTVFHSKFLQFLFSTIHPRWAFALGHSWSKHSRLAKTDNGKGERYLFKGEGEPLFIFAEEFARTRHIDYFIFGHFHTPTLLKLPSGAEFHILGEWIHSCQYLIWDGTSLKPERGGSL